METSDVKTEVITTKNYEIWFWADEECRDEGIRDFFDTHENKEEAIGIARALYDSVISFDLGSVEVISDDEDEGEYGVVYHFSENCEKEY